jgi:SSS family solute:Na+ symporter
LSLAIALAYLLTILTLGLLHRRHAGEEEFFLAGRSVAAFPLTGSMIATIFGAFGVMGVAGIAYQQGLVAGWYHWVGTIGLLLLAFWALRRVSLERVYTLPELMGQCYGPAVRRGAGLLIAVAWLSIVAAQFLAAGKVLQFLWSHSGVQAFGGLPTEWWSAMTGFAVCAYAMIGGQRSVIRTDFLQAILIFIGVLLLFTGMLSVRPGVFQEIAQERWQFPFSSTMSPVQWLELLLTLGVPFLVGPDIYSRVLSGRDVRTGQRAVLGAALVMIPLVSLIVLCGMMARVFVPEVADRELVLMVLANNFLHPAVFGLLAAALLSAIMSSADTCLMTISTIATRDLFPTEAPAADATFRGRVVIVAAGAAAVLLAVYYSSIIKALYVAYQLYSPAVLVPFVAMLVWRGQRFASWTGVAAMSAGAGVSAVGLWLDVKAIKLFAYAAPALVIMLDRMLALSRAARLPTPR